MILTLRLVHIFSAAFLVGAAAFHYFLLRPALRLIPPAHGATLTRSLGVRAFYLYWGALVLLAMSGLLRLYLRGGLEAFLSLDLFAESHLRALALMSFAWLVILAIFSVMTVRLRSQLTGGAVTAPAGRASGTTGAQPVRWLDQMHLLLVIVSILAYLAGASMVEGGLF